MSDKTLIIHGSVIQPGSPDRVCHDAAVLVQGHLIQEVGPTDDLVARHPDASVVNARGRIVMPGLINAHMHLYSTLALGLAGKPAANFPEILAHLWWKLDRALSLEDVYYSALIPYYRCIVSGTTTVIDHHASPFAVEGSLDRLEQAAALAGIRSAFCYEVSDRDGPTIRDAGLKENLRYIQKTRSSHQTLFKGLMGLHASMTVSDETLDKAVAAAGSEGVGVHVHAAEDLSDQTHCMQHYGKRVIQRFHDAKALGPRSILAHCIHLDDSERELLTASRTFVAHNPESNMNNAVGTADILGLLSRGAQVGLGTDGMTSDMRQEARVAMLSQRQHKADPTVAFGEAVEMLVRNNARFASDLFGVPLGVLEPGAAADVIVVEHYPFTPLSGNNWFGHFLFGIQPARVSHTMVHGRWLMVEGQVLTLDLEEVCARIAGISPETWQRFHNMPETR